MEPTFIHIITSKVPDRYTYDGSADLYWKIISFQKAGFDCVLHIIHRPSAIADAIRAHCTKIYFYERSKGHSTFSLKAPISVNRMFNQTLLERLREDENPMYFDGIQTTYYLTFPDISKRIHFIHFTETYTGKNPFKNNTNSSFLYKVNQLLKSIVYSIYQNKILKKAWVISEKTRNSSRNHHNNYKQLILPPFIGLPISRSQIGVGSYCLLHGDFKNSMTRHFALWLLDTIFSNIDIPLVVAGKYPSNRLEMAAHRELHTCLVADPSESELTELISKSQLCIHLDLTNGSTDHAILLSLQYGRHVLKIKEESIGGEEENKNEIMNQITLMFSQPFSEKDIETRENYLNMLSQDVVSTQRILEIIRGHYQ